MPEIPDLKVLDPLPNATVDCAGFDVTGATNVAGTFSVDVYDKAGTKVGSAGPIAIAAGGRATFTLAGLRLDPNTTYTIVFHALIGNDLCSASLNVTTGHCL